MESEKLLEKKLSKEVTKAGGLSFKFWAMSHSGLPDRIILIPGGKIFFIEVKSTGEKPTKIQVFVHNKLRKMGFVVLIIDSSEQIKKFIQDAF